MWVWYFLHDLHVNVTLSSTCSLLGTCNAYISSFQDPCSYITSFSDEETETQSKWKLRSHSKWQGRVQLGLASLVFFSFLHTCPWIISSKSPVLTAEMLWHHFPWPMWGSELPCLWTETPRLCCWCSSPGVGYVLPCDCSDSYRMSAAAARPVTSAVPGLNFSRESEFRGKGVVVREEESHAISSIAHLFLLFLLSQLNDICISGSQKKSLVKCHRLQHEQFSILHFSPCHLPYTPQVPFLF